MSNVTYTSTFDGDALMKVIAQTILQGNALSDGLLTQHTGITKKREIPIANFGVDVQDSACKFNDDEKGIVFAPRYLEPKGFMINKEICFKDIKDTYFAFLQARGEAGNYESTELMREFVVEYMAKYSNQFIDSAIWNGSALVTLPNVDVTAVNSVVDGILPNLEDDAAVLKNASPLIVAVTISKATSAVITVASTADLTVGTDVTIKGAAGGQFTSLNGKTFKVTAVTNATTFTINANTSALTGNYTESSANFYFINEKNVISVLTDLYVQLPEEVENEADFSIIVNNQILKAYKLATAKVANGAGSYMVGNREVDLLGFPLKRASYFPKNTLLASRTSNLHFGTDLSGEDSNVEVIDMRIIGDNTYRYKSMWEFDVNHTLGSEIVLVRPA